MITFVQSAYRHFKPIAAWGDGADCSSTPASTQPAPGVAIVAKATAFAKASCRPLGTPALGTRATHPTRDLEQAD